MKRSKRKKNILHKLKINDYVLKSPTKKKNSKEKRNKSTRKRKKKKHKEKNTVTKSQHTRFTG